MKHYEYNIKLFHYSKSTNTLIGKEQELFDKWRQCSFPNQRKQFYITNYKTNNFRRFRLLREATSYYIFTSVDNIKCIVLKELNLTSTN